MNELTEIDSSFSILNENKFTGLILYGSDKFYDKKTPHFNVHHKIHQRFSKIWRKPAIIFLSINLKWIYVLFICMF